MFDLRRCGGRHAHRSDGASFGVHAERDIVCHAGPRARTVLGVTEGASHQTRSHPGWRTRQTRQALLFIGGRQNCGNQQAKLHFITASPSCSHTHKLHSCDAAHQMTWHIFEAGATSPANPNRRQHGVRRETPQGRRQRRPILGPILRGHRRSKSCASRTEWNGPTDYQRPLGGD